MKQLTLEAIQSNPGLLAALAARARRARSEAVKAFILHLICRFERHLGIQPIPARCR